MKNLSDQELSILYRSHMEYYKASVEQMKLISTEQRVRTLEARRHRAKEYYAKCQADLNVLMNSYIFQKRRDRDETREARRAKKSSKRIGG